LTGGNGVSVNLENGSAEIKNGSAKNEIGADTETTRLPWCFHEVHLTLGITVA